MDMNHENTNHDRPPQSEQLLLNEVQVLLAEKRTYFALLRTGIAVFTMPLTIIAFLIASSSYHNLFDRFIAASIVIGGLTMISLFGLSIFSRSQYKLKKINELLRDIKKHNQRIREILI